MLDSNQLIHEEGKNGEIKSNISAYIGKPGVWALYGISEKSSKEICLNVGSCIDIGREILYDLACIHHLEFRNDGDKEYINQFKKACGFKYRSGQTQEYLYPFIAKNFHSIKFILIHDKNDKQFEKAYAEKMQANYWRNGAPYTTVTISISKKQSARYRIGELFPSGGEIYSLDEMIELLYEEFGYERKYAVRIINEMVAENLIIKCDENNFTR